MASSPGGDQGSSNDQILEVGAVLLKDFIYERVHRHGDSNAVVTRQQLGVGELTDPHVKELAHCLDQIGNVLDGELHRIKVQSHIPSRDQFQNVARDIFFHGNVTWGRVVALFYFTCRLVIKAPIRDLPDLIRTIVGWTIDFLREHVVNWIRDQGGWEGIRSHFGTRTWQTLAVFLAGVLTAALIIQKM